MCSNQNVLIKPQKSTAKPENSDVSRMEKADISYTFRLISNC